MQVGVTLLKQVGDVIRLSKENFDCSILVFSEVMLISPSKILFPNSSLALVRQENRLFMIAFLL